MSGVDASIRPTAAPQPTPSASYVPPSAADCGGPWSQVRLDFMGEVAGVQFDRMGAFWIAWVLLSLSIITTKQHFIWDMVTGGLLGWALWKLYILPRLDRRLRSEHQVSVATSS